MITKHTGILEDLSKQVRDLHEEMHEVQRPHQNGPTSFPKGAPNVASMPPGWYYFGAAPPMDPSVFWNQLNQEPGSCLEQQSSSSTGIGESALTVVQPVCHAPQVITGPSEQLWEPMVSAGIYSTVPYKETHSEDTCWKRKAP